MKIPTRDSINKEIKKLGYSAELKKGKGYFYFVGDCIEPDSGSVYVTTINQLTFEEWIEEFRYFISE